MFEATLFFSHIVCSKPPSHMSWPTIVVKYQIFSIEEKINRTTFRKWIVCWTPDVNDILKILWKSGESPLFHNILLPVVRFPC